MTASHRGYPQATGTSTSQQQQQQPQYVDIGSTTDQSSAAAAAATTAYLVQTPNGSALLIPPPFLNQALVSTTSSSLTRAPNPSAAVATAAATSTMNPYGITTIPLTHSPSINLNLASHHHLIRPESTASTNVYQTIDAAEKWVNIFNTFFLIYVCLYHDYFSWPILCFIYSSDVDLHNCQSNSLWFTTTKNQTRLYQKANTIFRFVILVYLAHRPDFFKAYHILFFWIFPNFFGMKNKF